MPPRLLLSLSGSGHLLCYQLGVVRALLHDAPKWGAHMVAFAGTSGGAIVAAAAALLPRETPSALDRFAEAAFRGGAFAQLAHELEPGCGSVRASSLADASGSLFLGATACETGEPATLCRFSNAEALLTCVLASAAIPRSVHPLDVLLAGGRPLRYPEHEGIFVPSSCAWAGDEADLDGAPPAADDDAPRRAHVGGGLSSALPRLPATALERLRISTVLTVSPAAGPRGASTLCEASLLPCARAASAPADARAAAARARGGLPTRFHVCPARDGSWARLPLPPLSLGGGLRCDWSAANARAAAVAVLGASPAALRDWFERGRDDAAELLVARGSPVDVLLSV
ncbi:hypothetical protein KFE25_012048 [Diacronema lutheri]|uniref:PNPLA domain-containing protein n=1 Tax=Diacronema lutheri TaxID=2081491 RepID=A0A8J5X994_DIALT|nr:hypothetical protein KFE25_012048 [Diacronema lutheri]